MRNIEKKIDNTSPSSTGRLSAAEFNSYMDELEQAVDTAEITLDAPGAGDVTKDTDLQMLAQAMAKYASGGLYGRDIGATNAYVIVPRGKFIPPKALFEGMTVRFWPRNNNSGASTLNAFGLGSKKLLDQDGNALSSGTIRAGRTTEATYDPALDTGAGAWKLSPASNQNIVSGGGASAPSTPSTPGSLASCLTGLTGNLTGIAGCGEAVYSSQAQSSGNYSADAAFGGTFGTPGSNDTGSDGVWEPTAGTIATNEWIGWDWDPAEAGRYATIDQAKFQQFFNTNNQNDVWNTVQVEVSSDLVTWTPVAVITGCTHPSGNAAGPIESVTFTAVNCRAMRLRPTSVTRYTSATVLVQCAVIVEVQFIKT